MFLENFVQIFVEKNNIAPTAAATDLCSLYNALLRFQTMCLQILSLLISITNEKMQKRKVFIRLTEMLLYVSTKYKSTQLSSETKLNSRSSGDDTNGKLVIL